MDFRDRQEPVEPEHMKPLVSMAVPQSTAYGWMMLAGIVVSILFWSRLARRDNRLLAVYIAARETGLTKAQAAMLSRNATVDFNKGGPLGHALNSLYAFSKGSISPETLSVLAATVSSCFVSVGLASGSEGNSSSGRT